MERKQANRKIQTSELGQRRESSEPNPPSGKSGGAEFLKSLNDLADTINKVSLNPLFIFNLKLLLQRTSRATPGTY